MQQIERGVRNLGKATAKKLAVLLYIGANPARPVVLRPVSDFHDSPLGSG